MSSYATIAKNIKLSDKTSAPPLEKPIAVAPCSTHDTVQDNLEYAKLIGAILKLNPNITVDEILKKLGYIEGKDFTFSTYTLAEVDGGGELIVCSFSNIPQEVIDELVRRGLLRKLSPAESAQFDAMLARATLMSGPELSTTSTLSTKSPTLKPQTKNHEEEQLPDEPELKVSSVGFAP
jgi:hypothetical protein